MEEEIREIVRKMYAFWMGILDRLEYDERIIDSNLRSILEEEFEYLIGLTFDVDAKNIGEEVKRIIYSS
jgi:hypothetical protein